nr:VOC family protein [Burkholderia stagnalis]
MAAAETKNQRTDHRRRRSGNGNTLLPRRPGPGNGRHRRHGVRTWRGLVLRSPEQPETALFRLADIAHDPGMPVSGRGATEFTIGHNVESAQPVDQAMQQAVAAGARLVKPAGTTFRGGYSGYFQDPDGHEWEVVFNSAFVPGD